MNQEDIDRRRQIAQTLLRLAHDLLETAEAKPGDETWTCDQLAALWQELGCGIGDLQPQIATRPPIRKR